MVRACKGARAWLVCAVITTQIVFAWRCAWSPAYLDAQGRFLPRLRLETGREFSLRVSLNQKLLRTFRKRTRRVLQYYAFTYDFRVLENKANRISLRVTYRRARIRRRDGARSVDFDSDKPTRKISRQVLMYTTLKGRSFTLVLDDRGRVLELLGVREMVTGMVRDLGLKRARDRRKYARLIALQFGPETLRESMRALFTPFPTQALRAGESWSSAALLSRGIPLSVEKTWTLKALTSSTAVLGARMLLKPNTKAGSSPVGLMRARYYLQGTQEGESTIHPASGLLTAGEMHQVLKGSMLLSGGPLRKAIRIPMQIDSRIEYKRVR